MLNFELANRDKNRLAAAAVAGGLAVTGLLVWAESGRDPAEQATEVCPIISEPIAPSETISKLTEDKLVRINVENLGKVPIRGKPQEGIELQLYDKRASRQPFKRPVIYGDERFLVEDKTERQYEVEVQRTANEYADVSVCLEGYNLPESELSK